MAPLPMDRVLIADADVDLRRLLHKRLLDFHLFADCVADGRLALSYLRDNSYGVIVLDIGLPNVGSERVLEYVRQLERVERPVILVLAEAAAARSLDVDLVQIVLRKPCDMVQLAELVQSCIRTSTTLRQPINPRTVATRSSA
jgi:DNA-binding response OmpR family regulator